MGRHIIGLFSGDYDPDSAGIYILGSRTPEEEQLRTNGGRSQGKVRGLIGKPYYFANF